MTPYGLGWVRQLPDIRDERFAFGPTLASGALPPSYDLSDDPPSVPPWEPVWNQGSIGSCGPHSMGANVVFNQFIPLRGLAAAAPVMPSRLFLYYAARTVMGTVGSDSGVSNRDMLKALARYGWCDESLWPYDPAKFTTNPPRAVWDKAAAMAAQIVYRAVAQDLATMKACLVETDRPIIFGFSVYQSMMSAEVQRTGVIPFPTSRDRQAGGHDVLIVGYDDARQAFRLRNSWGQWGERGYGWIPYRYATNPNLAGDFWSVSLTGNDPTPRPPDPPDPPPPDDGRLKPVSAVVTYDPQTGGWGIRPN